MLDFAAVLSKQSPHLHHWHHSSQAGGDDQAWTELRKQMTHFVVYACEPSLIGVASGSSPCFRCLTRQRGGKHCLHGKLIFMFRMWNSSPPFANVFKNLSGGACQHKLECLTITKIVCLCVAASQCKLFESDLIVFFSDAPIHFFFTFHCTWSQLGHNVLFYVFDHDNQFEMARTCSVRQG